MLPGPLPREVAGYLFIATQFSPDAKCGFLHLWASSPPEHFCVSFPEGGPAAGVAERGATSRGGASRDLLSVLGLCHSPAVAASVSWDGVSQVLVGKPIAACGHHYVQLPSACCRGPPKTAKLHVALWGVMCSRPLVFNCLRRVSEVTMKGSLLPLASSPSSSFRKKQPPVSVGGSFAGGDMPVSPPGCRRLFSG